jgi:lysozyme
MRLPGIDISHHQGTTSGIDWDKVGRQGFAFAILKATEGLTYKDPELRGFWAELSARGIPCGAYHLIRLAKEKRGQLVAMTPGEIADQVGFYLHTVAGLVEPGEALPPVLDLETRRIDEVARDLEDPALAQDLIVAWLEGVESALGVTPILYTSPRGVRHLEGYHEKLARFTLWDVDYGDGEGEPTLPASHTDWTLWQWTSDGGGKAAGFESNGLDRDWFNGGQDKLDELVRWGQSPAEPGDPDQDQLLELAHKAQKRLRQAQRHLNDLTDLLIE